MAVDGRQPRSADHGYQRRACMSDVCGDFSGHTILWSAHALDRAEERGKSIVSIEVAVKQGWPHVARPRGRCEIEACVDGELTSIIVRELGHRTLVVVTIIGKGQPCR